MRDQSQCQEFHCLRDGLAHSSLHEQALALDLLIGAMIANGFVADRSVVGEGSRKSFMERRNAGHGEALCVGLG